MKRFLVLLILVTLAACRATSDPSQALGTTTRIVIEGARAFAEQELLRAIDADRYGAVPERATRAMVDDAAYAIEELYRSDGYADVEVDYEYDEDGTAVFRIEEGARFLLTEATFGGNEGVDSATLARFFLPDEEPVPFVRSQLPARARQIENYYYEKGWLRARVPAVEPVIDAGTSAVAVACTVVEGPRFHLRAVHAATVEGAAPLPAGIREELDEAVAARVGRPFLPRIGFSLRATLVEGYARRGYPDATAPFEADLDEESGDVALSYTVEPGPLVTIGAIRVEGTQDVDGDLVLERLAIREGEPYDTTKVRTSFANLYRSGLFRSVRIDLQEGQGTVRDLTVTVEEHPSLQFFVQPGYGSYKGANLVLGLDERNFLGTGTSLRAEGTLGALDQGASLTWTDPWIHGGDFETRVTVFAENREEPSFTETAYGTEWSLTRVWNRELRSTLTYRYRTSELEDIDLNANDPLLEDALEDVDIGSIGLSTTFDDRTGLFAPTGGGRKRAAIVLAREAFGSEVDYLGGNLEATHFFELSPETVLALRFGAGLKAPIGDSDTLPVQERFFNGGENTVRSFKQDELGPVDSGGEPVGGEAYNLLGVELRRHLVGSLQGGLFYDAGNVASEVEDYLDFDGFQHGVGLGLRYLLPIGPVRLDVAWNPDARGEEDDFVLHFAIGMAF